MMNYIISALAIFSFFYLIKEVFEVLFLKQVLLKILNKKRIETKLYFWIFVRGHGCPIVEVFVDAGCQKATTD